MAGRRDVSLKTWSSCQISVITACEHQAPIQCDQLTQSRLRLKNPSAHLGSTNRRVFRILYFSNTLVSFGNPGLNNIPLALSPPPRGLDVSDCDQGGNPFSVLFKVPLVGFFFLSWNSSGSMQSMKLNVASLTKGGLKFELEMLSEAKLGMDKKWFY